MIANKLYDLGYTDIMDVSPEESLYHNGIMRNPKTNRVIYIRTNYATNKTFYAWTTVTIEDIREYLENAQPYFYFYIGSDRDTELRCLNNNHLATIIETINSWDGEFGITYAIMYWDYDEKQILEIAKDK